MQISAVTRSARTTIASIVLLGLSMSAARGQVARPMVDTGSERETIGSSDTIRFVHSLVRQRMSRGVAVSDTSHRTLEGIFLELQEDALVLAVPDGDAVVPIAQISELQVRRGSQGASVLRGARGGALLGAVAGAAIMAVAVGGQSVPFGRPSNWIGGGAGAGLLLGGAVGALVNLFREVPDWHDAAVPPRD